MRPPELLHEEDSGSVSRAGKVYDCVKNQRFGNSRLICISLICAGMASVRARTFAEARKRSARGKAMEVIDVEPLASIDPTEKGRVPPLKRKMGFEMHLESKLMGDTIKIIRTSRRLAGMKPLTPGGSSSVGGSAGIQGSRSFEKSGEKGAVYTPCWNVDKHS